MIEHKTIKFWLNKRKVYILKLLLFIVMSILAFVIIAPFLWVFSSSFRTYSQAVSLPPKWIPPAFKDMNFKYYSKLFDGTIPFLTWMWNSLKVAIGITAGMVVNGCLAGYAYARLEFKGKNIFFAIMMIGIMIPIQVTIVPLYQIMNIFGFVNTHWALMVPSFFGASCPGLAGAFGIFMMRQYFMTLPKEMEEAARIDGAGIIRTFLMVILPMARTTIVSLAILVFTFAWNDFFNAFIMINSTEKLTLPVGILQAKQPLSTGDNVVLTAVCLSIIPVLLVYIVAQKWITESMVRIGIKG
jgi:multiple sugar transport system permease protein